MDKIISHLSEEYKKLNIGHGNGAFYYSKELLENIVPHIKTDRPWCLINAENQCDDDSIVFIHNNKNPERYEWLKGRKNLILVCSKIKTLETMIKMFPQYHCIFIPLSIDTEYVKQFKVKRKTKDTAYFGRLEKCPKEILDNNNIEKIYGNIPREKLLREVAKFKNVYAIGRCAIEAKCLGCKVKSHKGEYDGIDFKVVDNKEVIPELQRLIDEIDSIPPRKK